jgi:hypothetical protein
MPATVSVLPFLRFLLLVDSQRHAPQCKEHGAKAEESESEDKAIDLRVWREAFENRLACE